MLSWPTAQQHRQAIFVDGLAPVQSRLLSGNPNMIDFSWPVPGDSL